MDSLTIGQVATKAKVNIETLRYYERKGLLPKPPRTASNYRSYPEDAVRRVRFIKRAQELGFTLVEIRELLSLRALPGASCAEVRKQAELKMADIDGKIRLLQAMRGALSTLISECSGRGPVSECPILDTLNTERSE